MSNITIEQLQNNATLNDVALKVKEIKTVNESVRGRLKTVAESCGANVNENDTLQTVVGHVEERMNRINDLLIPNNEKIQTYNYTNSDGMTESYNWIDMNGYKVMWVNVKLSDNEYGMGSGGLLMKTLNIPAQAQIFSNMIMANITSYCRSGNDTLSRIVQNAEIISTTSVRARWRHTDNTYPRIDRFTIMITGF